MKEDTEMLNPQSTSQRWGRDVCFLCRVLVGHIAGSRGTFSRSARAEIRKEIGLAAYDEEIIFARIGTSSGMIPREMYLRLLDWFDANWPDEELAWPDDIPRRESNPKEAG